MQAIAISALQALSETNLIPADVNTIMGPQSEFKYDLPITSMYLPAQTTELIESWMKPSLARSKIRENKASSHS